jgi:hypothetical protein
MVAGLLNSEFQFTEKTLFYMYAFQWLHTVLIYSTEFQDVLMRPYWVSGLPNWLHQFHTVLF